MTEGFDYDKVGSWHGPVHRALSPAVRFMWDLQIDGLEHVPEDGPAILAPNHISFLDSSFLLFLLERQITFVGKAEYLDSRWRSVVYPRLGMIPVDRRGGDHAQAALDAARGVLESGGLFGIFPEGTRSRNGHLHKGRTGAARLSLETGAPIIPVGIIGTEKIMPPDARAPQLFRTCAIRFGRPVRPERYAERADDPLVARTITDEVMFEIRELTGQRYIPSYATSGTPKPEQPATPVFNAPAGIPQLARS